MLGMDDRLGLRSFSDYTWAAEEQQGLNDVTELLVALRNTLHPVTEPGGRYWHATSLLGLVSVSSVGWSEEKADERSFPD